MLPLQVWVPDFLLLLLILLVKGGRLWRSLRVWALQLAQSMVLQELKTGNSRWTISRSSKGGHAHTQSNPTTHSTPREKEVSVLWTITQPCIEDYRITLCPLHHQVAIEHNSFNGKLHFLLRIRPMLVGLETSAVPTWRTKTTSLSRFNSQTSLTLTSTSTTARFSVITFHMRKKNVLEI